MVRLQFKEPFTKDATGHLLCTICGSIKWELDIDGLLVKCLGNDCVNELELTGTYDKNDNKG